LKSKIVRQTKVSIFLHIVVLAANNLDGLPYKLKCETKKQYFYKIYK